MPSNGDFRNYSLLVGWVGLTCNTLCFLSSLHKLQIAEVSSCTVRKQTQNKVAIDSLNNNCFFVSFIFIKKDIK